MELPEYVKILVKDAVSGICQKAVKYSRTLQVKVQMIVFADESELLSLNFKETLDKPNWTPRKTVQLLQNDTNKDTHVLQSVVPSNNYSTIGRKYRLQTQNNGSAKRKESRCVIARRPHFCKSRKSPWIIGGIRKRFTMPRCLGLAKSDVLKKKVHSDRKPGESRHSFRKTVRTNSPEDCLQTLENDQHKETDILPEKKYDHKMSSTDTGNAWSEDQHSVDKENLNHTNCSNNSNENQEACTSDLVTCKSVPPSGGIALNHDVKQEQSGITFNKKYTCLKRNRLKYCHNEMRGRLQCKVCDQNFPFGTNFARHVRQCQKNLGFNAEDEVCHTDPRRRFHCKSCDKSFTFRTNLTRHVRQFHRKLVKAEDENFDSTEVNSEEPFVPPRNNQISQESCPTQQSSTSTNNPIWSNCQSASKKPLDFLDISPILASQVNGFFSGSLGTRLHLPSRHQSRTFSTVPDSTVTSNCVQSVPNPSSHEDSRPKELEVHFVMDKSISGNRQDSINSQNSSTSQTIDVVNVSNETSSNCENSTSVVMRDTLASVKNQNSVGSASDSHECGLKPSVNIAGVCSSGPSKGEDYDDDNRVDFRVKGLILTQDVPVEKHPVPNEALGSVLNSDATDRQTSPVTYEYSIKQMRKDCSDSETEEMVSASCVSATRTVVDGKTLQKDKAPVAVSKEQETFPVLGLYDMVSPAKNLDTRFLHPLTFSPVRSPLFSLATSPITSSTPFYRTDLERKFEARRLYDDVPSPTLSHITAPLLNVPSYLPQSPKMQPGILDTSLDRSPQTASQKEFIDISKLANSVKKTSSSEARKKTTAQVVDLTNEIAANGRNSDKTGLNCDSSQSVTLSHESKADFELKLQTNSPVKIPAESKLKAETCTNGRTEGNGKSGDLVISHSGRATTNKYRFNCTLCSAKFTFRTNLTRHMKKQHGMTPGELELGN